MKIDDPINNEDEQLVQTEKKNALDDLYDRYMESIEE